MTVATESQTPSKSLSVPVEGVPTTTQYLVPALTANGEKLATARVQQVPAPPAVYPERHRSLHRC
jgi:hypothetical protein